MGSFFPALLGLPLSQQPLIYWAYFEASTLGSNEAVRVGSLKAVRRNMGLVEVYDLTADPYEQADIAGTAVDFANEARAAMDGIRVSPKSAVYLPVAMACQGGEG